MQRRKFLRNFGLSFSATLLGIPFLNHCASPANKPNIIYIMADDLGYGDLGCYGQERIKTPNLDRMANQGMRFTQHYAGSTVCAPSRCSLMTGKHTGHCTVRGNVNVLLMPEEDTVAEILRQNGYATACIGKWGIGHPPPPEDPHRNGFDHFFGYLSMWHAHNYYPEFLWRNGEKVPLENVVQHPETHSKENQAELVGLASKKAEYSHDLFTRETLDYIEHQDSPFFLYLSYTIPHANNEAGRFGAHGMEVPEYTQYQDEDWPEVEKAFAAMVTRLDQDIGRIFDKLKQKGIDENTLVLFTSDNGPHAEGGHDPAFFDSNGLLRGIKRDLYEGGIRVPMIARWPGKIQAGSETEHPSAFWDFLPTALDVAGIQQPEGLDGISYLPTLLRNAQQPHDYLYWEFPAQGGKQAVRLVNWKGIRLDVRENPENPLEIYNLEEDPGEQHDVATENPEVAAEVEQIMAKAHTRSEITPLTQIPKPVREIN